MVGMEDQAYLEILALKDLKGNWIAFLDSDDYWIRNKLKKQVEIIKRENCNIISSNAYINDKKTLLQFSIFRIKNK